MHHFEMSAIHNYFYLNCSANNKSFSQAEFLRLCHCNFVLCIGYYGILSAYWRFLKAV